MLELKRIFAKERPIINAAIARSIAELPEEARSVAMQVLSTGGKRLRPLLTVLTGRALGAVASVDLYTLGAAIEILHAATLLHDDILDNAVFRRGKPAAHTLFGAGRVILAGDVLLAKALHMVSIFDDARLTSCLSEAVLCTATGELAEFFHLRDTNTTHADYLRMITGKTAWMLCASCKLGALRAGANTAQVQDAATFGRELGVAFQIVDDSLDFSPTQKTGKPRAGDLKEGKVTPPLLLYLADMDDKAAERFKQRFAAGDLSAEELKSLCEAIYEGEYALKARSLADRHLDRAVNMLDRFPSSAEKNMLRQMVFYVQNREE